MSSKYERDEALYREIINFANGKPRQLEPGSTDLVKAEIADRYIRRPEISTDIAAENSRRTARTRCYWMVFG